MPAASLGLERSFERSLSVLDAMRGQPGLAAHAVVLDGTYFLTSVCARAVAAAAGAAAPPRLNVLRLACAAACARSFTCPLPGSVLTAC